MIDDFFSNLSNRFRSENNLSDITWALAKSSPKFQLLFLKFFFNDLPDTLEVELFKREYSENSCRPDFYIRAGGINYIIECKIFDRNHHFEQYKAQFPSAQFGYITNYPLIHTDKDFIIREWTGFRDYLVRALRDDTDEVMKKCILGYTSYLTNICGIFNLKKMKLNELSSLHHFNRLLTKIIYSLNGRTAAPYNQGKSFDANRSGLYFSLQIDDQVTIYPWLGIYYTDTVYIYLEINEKSCRNFYDICEQVPEGEYFNEPWPDDEYGKAMCFELRQKYFDRFNHETTTVEEQENIIRSFLSEVFEGIGI